MLRVTLTMTSVFIMSDRAASRGTFRIEANQTSKMELYILALKASSCETYSHKVPSSMLDCVHTREKTTHIGFSTTCL